MQDLPTNGKLLIIVESPTKAKTIKRFLPSNCTVLACNGHIRDLPSDELSIDVKHGYKPKYVVAKGKDKIIKSIKDALKTSDALLLATDEDREGESISWHLLEVLHPAVPYQRMVFHEITKRAIEHALSNGRELDMSLVRAQEARRILDRLYGYTLSPLLWKKLSNKKLSAGRVQSPGLRLIVERERERILFQKSVFWDAKALLLPQGGKTTFEAKLESLGAQRIAQSKDFDPSTGDLKNPQGVLLLSEEQSEKLVESLQGSQWNVLDITEKPVVQRPAPPFITSSLQQEGNRKLRLSAKETMRIAQKLYENGLITYMRTDSPALSQEGTNAARASVSALYGNEYLSKAPRQYKAKSASAQEAHEAIRPSGHEFVHPDASGLKGKELALYELIWKRTLASQMADAQKASTTVKVGAKTSDGELAVFTATGIQILFPGFIRVYVEGSDDPDAALDEKETLLPPLKAQDALILKELSSVMHETKPPVRYTEASLVQQLEKMGIGRPSTYATIIDKLFERDYVIKDGTALVPMFTGFGVIQLLERYFATMVDYDFTSRMEAELDKVATGSEQEQVFLSEFYEGPKGLKEQVDTQTALIKPAEAKQIDLPQISGSHPVMIGPYGPYVVDTKGAKPEYISLPDTFTPGSITNEDIERLLERGKEVAPEAPPVGTDPATGLPILLCNGRFGAYWQIGHDGPDNPNPKRVSVPKGKDGQAVPLSEILKYFSLPRVIGVNPETGQEVVANKGKYGPYVGSNGVFRSLGSDDELFTVTLDEALALLQEPRGGKAKSSKAREALVTFSEFEGSPLAIYSGKYGFYLKHGSENYALPNEAKKDENLAKQVTREQAIAIIEAKKGGQA